MKTTVAALAALLDEAGRAAVTAAALQGMADSPPMPTVVQWMADGRRIGLAKVYDADSWRSPAILGSRFGDRGPAAAGSAKPARCVVGPTEL